MRSIKSGQHTVELSWWVSLLSLLEGLMILSTKGTLDTFSCGGWWSSPAINNHCTRVSAS
ncbi:hypothetical protein TIFTF001_045884 [Ficus carica]|uniref:Uncharacterized protein n=1 Tax=Ficus carica TaxID=3494 RepID=A0AA87Z5I1_FICCA|nr:hypothetical protein TIFTF001_045884 [Ficus carica]